MRDTFLPLAVPSIGEEEIASVVENLRSGWLTTGPKTAKFEQLFAEYIGVKHAVALNSCSAALHLSALAIGVGQGDEVITTPITWPATSNMIVHTGAKPVFVDVRADTLNIDASLIESAITPRTKAIIPVHMAGQVCDMNEIRDIGKRNNIPIIEDAAHALGASYDQQEVGSTGEHTCFSFYATKNMTTGEGGMFTTNDEAVAKRVRLLSQHGVSRDAWSRESNQGLHWQLLEPGFKCNMSDVLSSIGIHQIDRLPAFIEKRRELASQYDNAISSIAGVTQLDRKPGRESAFHLYIVRINADVSGVTRDEMIVGLRERNIGSGVHFISTHLQPYYRDHLGVQPESLPVAAKMSDEILSLPLCPSMSVQDIQDVSEAIKEVIQSKKEVSV
ncbi:MAG: DegT/DnrJ/EryC1/StrS family aminotransferase [Phycisphaerales bacterium]